MAKDRSKLVKKVITDKSGKKTTVWVRPDSDESQRQKRGKEISSMISKQKEMKIAKENFKQGTKVKWNGKDYEVKGTFYGGEVGLVTPGTSYSENAKVKVKASELLEQNKNAGKTSSKRKEPFFAPGSIIKHKDHKYHALKILGMKDGVVTYKPISYNKDGIVEEKTQKRRADSEHTWAGYIKVDKDYNPYNIKKENKK